MEVPEFVKTVREETRRYIDDLLADNQRLRNVTATLEADKLKLREQRLGLQEDLLNTREDLEKLRDELRDSRNRLTEGAGDGDQFFVEYSKIESQNNILANLYVASYRLHSSAERDHVLEALNEIVVNLVGSEEFVVFEQGAEGNLEAVTWFGLDEEQVARVDPQAGELDRSFRSGEIFVADTTPGGTAPAPLVCIPLKLDGRSFGLIAILRLLPHKAGLEKLDYELFDLLAQQAAVALYTSRLHRQVGALEQG